MIHAGLQRIISPNGALIALATKVSYTPTWSVLSGTDVSPAGGGTGATVGSYVLLGDLVYFEIMVTFTNVTNFGTGQYTLTVPFAPKQNQAFRQGGLHSNSNHYTFMLDVPANSTVGKCFYIGSNGQDQAVNHNSPHTLHTNDFFYVAGTYIKA